MGSMASQRFAEFRDNLPLKCQCGEIFIVSDIDEEKYQKKILYVCTGCGHALWVGDFEGGIRIGKATF